jgi:NADH:ubiquinone oxidoreductase subunit 5 (subunit L)/multisubunit Na+/H+ antiporter MnhA subunit
LKAVIVNRVGDCALLLAFSLIAFFFGDLSYVGFFSIVTEGSLVGSRIQYSFSNFFSLFENSNSSYLDYIFVTLDSSFIFHKVVFLLGNSFDLLFLIGLLLCIGAFAKSAQFGLHTWLPDAMEGPTPVSALIHAATMVTAGVFLIIRCAPLFSIDTDLSLLLVIIGSITALFGASVAASQYDIKKIIAYSTCSQLGYMMVACGVAAYDLAIFHLATHACFKAGLFLCAGLIIHSLGDEQDIRKMGGLVRTMPVTYLAMFICSFCLGGLPFFSGFYSKDAIMEASLFYDSFGWFSFFILILAAFLTVFYSVRLFYYVFWREYAGSRAKVFLVHETLLSSIAVLTLSGLSIFLGFYFVFGNFKAFFEASSIMYGVIDQLRSFSYLIFWTNPSLDFAFSNYDDSLHFFHSYLPFIILMLIFSVMVFSFFFLFFFKQLFNEHLLSSALLEFSSLARFNLPLK